MEGQEGEGSISWFEAKLEEVKSARNPSLDLRRVISAPIKKDAKEDDKDNEKVNERGETELLFLAMLRLDFSDMAEYLRKLDLSENHLHSFFVEICDLVNLEVLDLHDNLIPSIPPEVEQLSKLEHLDIRNNLLATLPVELGKMKELKSICVCGNSLLDIDRSGPLAFLFSRFKEFTKLTCCEDKQSVAVKVVAVGDLDSKKAEMLYTYVKGQFPEMGITSFDNAVKSIEFNNRTVSLSIVDTDTEEDEHASLRGLTYEGVNVFLLCYSVINPYTFQHIKNKWFPEIHRLYPEVPIVLVGTQMDLRNEVNVVLELREAEIEPITPKLGLDLAEELGALKLVEVSAFHQIGLDELFECCLSAATNTTLEIWTGIRAEQSKALYYYQTQQEEAKKQRKLAQKNSRDSDFPLPLPVLLPSSISDPGLSSKNLSKKKKGSGLVGSLRLKKKPSSVDMIKSRTFDDSQLPSPSSYSPGSSGDENTNTGGTKSKKYLSKMKTATLTRRPSFKRKDSANKITTDNNNSNNYNSPNLAVPKRLLEIGEPLTFKHEKHISMNTGKQAISIVKDFNIEVMDMAIFVNAGSSTSTSSTEEKKKRRRGIPLKDILASDEYSWVDEKGNLKEIIGGNEVKPRSASTTPTIEKRNNNDSNENLNNPRDARSHLTASQFSWVDFNDENQMLRFENILKGIINEKEITDTEKLKKHLARSGYDLSDFKEGELEYIMREAESERTEGKENENEKEKEAEKEKGKEKMDDVHENDEAKMKEEREKKEKEKQERKEKEEREKKEKEEKEKEERERKEREEKAKKEKAAREKKEKEEREKKEKAEREKKEKEEKEKKEKAEREKKEKEQRDKKAREEKAKKEQEERERKEKAEKAERERKEKEQKAKNSNNTTPATEKGQDPLEAFLNGIGLANLVPIFKDEQITLDDLKLLEDKDFVALGLKLGPRKRIANALKSM